MFTFDRLAIPEVVLVTPSTYQDDRGFFRESFKSIDFAAEGLEADWPQLNVSRSWSLTLRGLHFQTEPSAVAKLVSVASGLIYDVAVDVRPESPTFGEHVWAKLSGVDGQALYVPEGFAHGFLALTNATVVYLMSGLYDPGHDAGVRYNDPAIGIDWPEEPTIVSAKDRALPLLRGIV